MAAETMQQSSGRRNYYSVSYGKLSTKVKEIPQDFIEISEADLKSKTQAVEQLDLRKKYVDKQKGDYPYVIFYDSLTGYITSQEKIENDNGTNLNLTVLDKDGDESILQLKFYSKYAENLLNRLLNTDTSKEITFFPYSIPNSAEIEGQTKTFYTSGVSIRVDGNKVEPKLKDKRTDPNSTLPDTAQVKVQGKMTTSRDERLDYLYSEFLKVFKPNISQSQSCNRTAPLPTVTASEAFEPIGSNEITNTFDQLPF